MVSSVRDEHVRQLGRLLVLCAIVPLACGSTSRGGTPGGPTGAATSPTRNEQCYVAENEYARHALCLDQTGPTGGRFTLSESRMVPDAYLVENLAGSYSSGGLHLRLQAEQRQQQSTSMMPPADQTAPTVAPAVVPADDVIDVYLDPDGRSARVSRPGRPEMILRRPVR